MGRELVRLDQDARRPHRAGCAGSSATIARRPRYLHTVRGVGFRFAAPEEWAAMSLRARLLLALAYVLLLAIVALEVPLALSLRDRVDAEVRSQARSPGRGRRRDRRRRPRRPATRARPHGRDRGRDRPRPRGRRRPRRARCSPTRAGTDRLGTDYGDRPEIAQALRAARPSRTAPQRHARPGDPRHRRADRRAAARRVGAVRVTQSVAAVTARDAPRDARPRR